MTCGDKVGQQGWGVGDGDGSERSRRIFSFVCVFAAWS